MKLGVALRMVWSAAALVVLLVAIMSYEGRPNDDAEVVLIYGMAALSFPLSVAVLWCVGHVITYVSSVFGLILTTTYLVLFVEWACFFVLGYTQWFKLVPWLVRKAAWRASNPPLT